MIGSDRLTAGEIEVIGLLPGSSNYTFLAKLEQSEKDLVVYKPRQGETPLWDFPEGTLCQREVAAYQVCELSGWEFVPTTVLRDGPLGVGAVQRFVPHDPSFTAFDADESDEPMLMKIALFDLMINNADRKAGHVLRGEDGGLWAIDHGVSFAAEPKLRTVLWDFIGRPIAEADLSCLRNVLSALGTADAGRLQDLLAPFEIEALQLRIEGLLSSGTFPSPGRGRPYPWPPI